MTWEKHNEEYLALLTNIPRKIAEVYAPALSKDQKNKILIKELKLIKNPKTELELRQEN